MSPGSARSRRAGSRRARASPRSNVVRRLRHLDRVVAEVGQDEVAQQRAAVRVRVRAHPPLARAARAPRARARARPSLVEELLGPVAPQPVLELAQVLGVVARRRASGTWCERHVPSTGRPSTSFGPVQPFGVRRTIIGQRGRSARRRRAPRAGSPRSRRAPRRARRRTAGAPPPGSSTRDDEDRAASRSPRRARAARSRGSARARSGSRSCSRSGAGSAARRRRVRGLRNLFECQLAASGPVSASPSPTTQATSRSGLSNAAPKACASA